MYGIAGVVLIVIGRFIDNKFIRPPSKTGFGKGAPGFMTNTRQIRVTPEIAARLRRGEQVSPEEIDAAVKAAEAAANAKSSAVASDSAGEVEEEAPRKMRTSPRTKKATAKAVAAAPTKKVEPEPVEEANEWIPEGHVKKTATRRKTRK